MTEKWPRCVIRKEYSFSAAHYLPNVGDNHPCKRMHGHNYRIEVFAYGEVNPHTKWWVVDFAELDKHMKPIVDELDHQTLNDIDGLENPTAECLSWWIYHKYPVKYLKKVRVWETDKCYAETAR